MQKDVLQEVEQELQATQAKRYPAYPAYRSSGVEWLGEVPQAWDVKRLKYIASINDETLPESIA